MFRTSRRLPKAVVTAIILSFALRETAPAATSELWGSAGDCWTGNSALPDFSQAGYARGAKPIPLVPVVTDVKAHGAVGDGQADDSAAFLSAIAAAQNGAVYIPAGRYRLRRQLKIAKSVVLRGAGRDQTTLYFPESLSATVGATSAPSSSWSWSGGYLAFQGGHRESTLASITALSGRGQTTVTVDTTARLSVGQPVRLVQTDPDGSLGRVLHNNVASASASLIGRRLIDFSAVVTSISGRQVTLDRPLRIEVRPRWQAQLHTDEPLFQNAGVEDLKIEFPTARYVGHHIEPGFNAIDFAEMTNSWVRRVTIVNADSGVFFRRWTRFCTVDDVRIEAAAGRALNGISGHHAFLAADGSEDNLWSNFNTQVRFYHDLSVSGLASGNVFSNGYGVDLNMDHHRKASFENLFTNIDAGLGSRLWESGGDEEDGPHTAARETYWRITTDRAQRLPTWLIAANVVGLTLTNTTSINGSWIDRVDPASLSPQNLHDAQVARARAGSNGACTARARTSTPPPVRVYPNPWRKDRYDDRLVTFDPSGVDSDVEIFTLSGRLVRRLPKSGGLIPWDLKNDSGELVASGLYLYVVSQDGYRSRGKLAVVR
jgi:hypothetical protein